MFRKLIIFKAMLLIVLSHWWLPTVAHVALVTSPLVTPLAAEQSVAQAEEALFTDDFTANTNSWSLGEYEDDYSTYENRLVGGQLQMALTFKQDALERAYIPNLSAQDFRLTVDAEVVTASAETEVLLSFREAESGNYYSVRFSTSGWYIVELLHNGTWRTIQDWTQSHAIRLQPGVVNTFSVLAKGDLFTIYVNEKELTTVKDAILAPAGKIGIGVSGRKGNTAVVQFDNLLITAEQAAITPQTAIVQERVITAVTSSATGSSSTYFRDDFNTTQLDPHWRWYYENRDGWTIKPLPGSLRIIGRPGDMAVGCNNPSNLLLRPAPSGDFEIFTRLSLNPTSNYQQAGLAIFSTKQQQPDLDHYVKLDLLWNSDLGGKSVELLWEENGQFPEQPWPYLPVTQSQGAWLKLVKTGTVFTGYYSEDGATWTQVGSRVVESVVTPLVGIYALAGATSESCQPDLREITVDFDYVRVNVADTAAIVTPSETATTSTPTARVTAQALNVRNGPGTQYNRIAGVQQGVALTVIGQVNHCAWLQVNLPDGKSGWVAGGPQYVALQTECEHIPVATAPALPNTAQPVIQTANQPSTAKAGTSTTQPTARQGSFQFQNQLGAEVTITLTSKDHNWSKSLKLVKNAEQSEKIVYDNFI